VPIESRDFLQAAQLSTGLYLSDLVDANRTLERFGQMTDNLGDQFMLSGAAKGGRNVRHDRLVAAWVSAAQQGLPRPVTKCTKGNKACPAQMAAAVAASADLNVGHIPDFVARGCARNGRHLVGEVKCYTCFVPSAPGSGSRGGIALEGATRAFGNTEEGIMRANFGLAERGIGSTAVFNRATGAGRVSAETGLYSDAVGVKRNTVLLLLSEITGGGERCQHSLPHPTRPYGSYEFGRDLPRSRGAPCAFLCLPLARHLARGCAWSRGRAP
jgi:hypothetical protein